MLFRFCNALMGMNTNMLGDAISDSSKQIVNVINNVVTALLAIAGACVAIYAIVLAIQFFRADSAEKREEAKKRLIYAIIGLVAAVVIIVVTRFVLDNILTWTKTDSTTTGNGNQTNSNNTTTMIKDLLLMLK